tara:strand:- start:2959 stop:5925 length:2967 start_codon:yes stop_codon:yes gene_type:complete
VAATILEKLNLQLKKIQILKNDNHDNSYRFKSHLFMDGITNQVKNLLEEFAEDLYVYFFILNENQYQEFYSLFSGPNRLRLLKNLEDRDLSAILRHQKNYYKKSLLDVLTRNKENLEKGNTILNLDVIINCTPSENTSSYHFISFVDRAPSASTTQSSSKIVYEKVLEKINKTSNYRVPKTREEFFIDDKSAAARNGQPYSGPYHYHSESNPGMSGYIGWMAGHPTGQMGFKLKKEQVKNYKIQDLRNLKIDLKQIMQLKPRTLYQSTGNDLEKKTLNQNKTKKSNNFLIESVNNSIQANMAKIGMYVTKDTELTAHVKSTHNSGAEFLNNSYFGSIISIDKFLICQNNTTLGPFMNFHRRMGNDSIAMLLMGSSKILNFSVIRRKISNNSFEKNKKPGPKVSELSGDYAERRIISTTEISGVLRSAVNSRCSIEEVEIAEPITSEAPRDTRSISLKDYDLFHNYETGQYTYDVEITLEDGSEKFITKLYNKYKQARSELESYIKTMETPATFNNDGKIVLGSYNYETDRSEFTTNSTSPKIKSVLNNMTAQISGAYTFLTGLRRPGFDLEVLLSPQVYDPDVARIVMSETRKVEKELLRILNGVSPAKKTQGLEANFRQNHINGSASGLRGLVFIKNQTNIVHDLDSITGLLADCGNMLLNNSKLPSIGQVFSDQLQLDFLNSPGVTKKSELAMEPTRILQIKKMKYEISQENLTFARSSENTLPSISDNPSIKIMESINNIPAGVTEIINKANFLQLNNFEKDNLAVRVSSIKSLGQVPGVADHTDDYYAQVLLKGKSGISVDLGSNEMQSIDTPPGAATVRSEILKVIPDASDSVLDNLVNSFYTSKNREEFDIQIQQKFKDLISLQKTLGSIYSEMGEKLQAESEKFNNKIKEKDYEKVFLKGSDDEVSNYSFNSSKRGTFGEESFHVLLIVPGTLPRRLSVSDMITMIRSSARGSTGKVCFLKFVKNKSSNIRLINDGVTLRI